MAELSYKIIHHYGILGKNHREWTKEVNIVEWRNQKPKLDIRDWEPEHKKMGRGITLKPDEAENLKYLFKDIDLSILKTAYEEYE